MARITTGQMPTKITGSQLAATEVELLRNAANTAQIYPYDATYTYALYEKCYVDVAPNRIEYQSIVAGNVGNAVSVTNKWKLTGSVLTLDSAHFQINSANGQLQLSDAIMLKINSIGSGGGSYTPEAPTLTANDNTDILVASSSLGNSEIVYSTNNGVFVPYAGQINVGNIGRSEGYYKFKIKAANGRNESSVVNSPAFTFIDDGSGNITPSAPAWVADDVLDTLTATSALGTGEIVVSENNGAYAPYADINVGNVARAAGYWKAKVKAATGRNESAVSNSPAFTVAIVGGTPILAPKFLVSNGSATQSTGNITATAGDTRSVVANSADTGYNSTLAIKIIEMQWNNSLNSKDTFLGLSTANFGDTYSALEFNFYISGSWALTGNLNGTNGSLSYSLPAASTSRVRIRAVEDTTYWRVFLETSTDSGSIWVVRNTVGQGGSAGFLSAIAKTSPLYGQFFANQTGAQGVDVKYTL